MVSSCMSLLCSWGPQRAGYAVDRKSSEKCPAIPPLSQSLELLGSQSGERIVLACAQRPQSSVQGTRCARQHWRKRRSAAQTLRLHKDTATLGRAPCASSVSLVLAAGGWSVRYALLVHG